MFMVKLNHTSFLFVNKKIETNRSILYECIITMSGAQYSKLIRQNGERRQSKDKEPVYNLRSNDPNYPKWTTEKYNDEAMRMSCRRFGREQPNDWMFWQEHERRKNLGWI